MSDPTRAHRRPAIAAGPAPGLSVARSWSALASGLPGPAVAPRPAATLVSFLASVLPALAIRCCRTTRGWRGYTGWRRLPVPAGRPDVLYGRPTER